MGSGVEEPCHARGTAPHAGLSVDRPRRRGFVAGMVLGAMVTAAATAALVAAGSLRPPARRVIVPYRPQAVINDASLPVRGLAGARIYDRDAPGVVSISSTGVSQPQSPAEYLKGESPPQGSATGTGFEIDTKGTILTDWHVVANASSISVSFGEHGKSVRARVIGDDPSHDLALLRVPTTGLTLDPLALGDSASIQVGEPVLAIGNPYGYDRTLSNGIISALGRQIQAPNGAIISGAIQTDVPINPGNSGGPLLNERGVVIGINSQIVTSGSAGGSVGISFAIPIDLAKGELPALEHGAG
jgi:S1-C subfamily serine protease